MRAGVYQGGIRTLEDLRLRCRMAAGGCWEWAGCLSKGRPNATVNFTGKHENMNARRAAWILSGGKLPEGYVVWQKVGCNNELCVNPGHCKAGPNTLFRQEIQARRQGCAARPALVKNGLSQRYRLAKLDAAKVAEIRASNDSSHDLSKRFGVSINAINDVRSMRTWRDVSGAAVRGASVFTWRPAA